MSLTHRDVVAGIFVGGRASRMRGAAKGLLEAPDGAPILVRTRAILEDLGASTVLVGAHPAYGHLGLETVADDAASDGPLGGLLALLDHAGARRALAIACDMPLLTHGLVRRLLEAPPAPIVAPRHAVSAHPGAAAEALRSPEVRWVWEPLFARYDAPVVLPVARAFASGGGRRLQLLLDRAGACPLPLTSVEEEGLVDWDAPEDVPRAPEDVPRTPEDVPRTPEDVPRSPEDVPRSPEDVPRSPEDLPRGSARGTRTP